MSWVKYGKNLKWQQCLSVPIVLMLVNNVELHLDTSGEDIIVVIGKSIELCC